MFSLVETVDKELGMTTDEITAIRLQHQINEVAYWPSNTMTVDEALAWSNALNSAGHKNTNGCSFAPDMGIHKICDMHDRLWQFKPVHKHIADAIFRKAIIRRGGFKYFIVGWVYWSAVRFVWLGGFYKFFAESYKHIKLLFKR